MGSCLSGHSDPASSTSLSSSGHRFITGSSSNNNNNHHHQNSRSSSSSGNSNRSRRYSSHWRRRGSSRPSSGESIESSSAGRYHHQPHIGKNQPLRKDRPEWKSDVPLTEGQLRSKRDEFWDTAPAFEGRKEIWDALKAAAYASESRDHSLAQAIIDGACISLPTGSLLDSYDELGNRYQIPVYCLAAPVNLIASQDLEDEDDKEEDYEEEEDYGDHGEQQSCIKKSNPDSPSPESEPYKCSKDSRSNSIIMSNCPNSSTPGANKDWGDEIRIKLRISITGSPDISFIIYTKECVSRAKHRFSKYYPSYEFRDQRWYFGGRLLHDKMRFKEIKLQHGFVIQVVIKSHHL